MLMRAVLPRLLPSETLATPPKPGIAPVVPDPLLAKLPRQSSAHAQRRPQAAMLRQNGFEVSLPQGAVWDGLRVLPGPAKVKTHSQGD